MGSGGSVRKLGTHRDRGSPATAPGDAFISPAPLAGAMMAAPVETLPSNYGGNGPRSTMYQFSPEALAYIDQVKQWAQEEVAPRVVEMDRDASLPTEIIDGIKRLGLTGVWVPKQYGGLGYDYQTYATIIEELARVDGSVSITVAAHNSLCMGHIYYTATEEQRQEWVVPLAKGEAIGSWGLTEPSSGSDAASLRSTARWDEEAQEWVLNGSKIFMTNGHIGDTFLLLARTEDDPSAKGITAFVCRRDHPGIELGTKEDKLGLRASVTSQVYMNDVRLPDSQRVGERGRGFIGAMQALDRGRISIAALGVGLAQGALDEVLRFARGSGAHDPTGAGKKQTRRHQHHAFKISDLAAKVDAVRSLTLRAAWLNDNDHPFSMQSSMAKYLSSEVSVEAGDVALEVIGRDALVEGRWNADRHYRDAKLCTIGEGTSEIQKLVISRHLGLQ